MSYTTMIATVGGQPQIVTFALQTLLKQGHPIVRLALIHLAPRDPKRSAALVLLKETLNQTPFDKIKVVEHVIAASNQRPISDIRDTATASKAWDTINKTIIDYKRRGDHLHICISGGRRILGMLVMSAAILNFEGHDRLWHMYTPEALLQEARDGARMRLPEQSDFALIAVPIMTLGNFFPNLREVSTFDTQQQLLNERERRRCRQVEEALTPRERDVLRAFAGGLTPPAVAEKLAISINTVDTHKTNIFLCCRTAWALAVDERLTYHFLREKFAAYFAAIP